jgi:hypothetical protein
MGTTTETIWAYILKSKKDTKSGRYRVRISRFTREQLRMISPDTEIEFPDGFQFGLQANLDIWDFTSGWVPMLDWMGDPETSDNNIIRQLNEQLKSFLTGQPTSTQEILEKWDNDDDDAKDTRAAWVQSKINSPPEPANSVSDDDVDEEVSMDDLGDDDDDDEWI